MRLTGLLTLLFAIAVGVIVTNLFAPQTLVGLIGPSLGFTSAAGGFVAMVTLLGDAGDQTLGRRAINLLLPEARGRINGLFVGMFFIGGAAGAALAGIVWASGGWRMICATGAAFGIAALVVDWIQGR
jgi:predicted MFS family arabinose efflux permease